MEIIRSMLMVIHQLDLDEFTELNEVYSECRNRAYMVWGNPNNSDPEMIRKAREKPWSKDAKRYAKRNPSFR